MECGSQIACASMAGVLSSDMRATAGTGTGVSCSGVGSTEVVGSGIGGVSVCTTIG